MVSRRVVLSYLTLATFLTCVLGRTKDEAPSFLKEPSSQIVKRFSKVRLKCEFLPKDAKIVWKFNGKPLENSSENEDLEFRPNHLVIKSFQSKGIDSHVGDYQCFVNTSIGSIVSRTAKLQVAYMKIMSFDPPVETSIYLGGTGVIECIPPRSKPPAIIQFNFKGQSIEGSSDRHRVLPSGFLQIYNVTDDDVGLYTCSAHNTINRHQTATSGTQLNIKQDTGQLRSIIYVAGASVFIGESAVLACVTEGAYVRWHRREQPMPDKAEQQWGNLLIENVRKHDMGEYTCSSYSDDGTVTTETVYLDVKIRPAIRNPPKDTSADPGKTLALKCSVVGEEDEIRWLFNTVPIDPLDTDYIADGRQLKIGELAVKHLGMYQCYVENELGSAQSSAEVKFSWGFELPSLNEKPTNMTAIESEEIFFLCSITGQPTPFTYWLNPHNELVSTDSRFFVNGEPETGGLTITDVGPQDAGWYTCVVKNIVGEVSARAYLVVLEKFVAVPTQHTPMPTIQSIEGAVSDEAQTATVNSVQHPVKNGAVPNPPGKPTVSEVTSSSVDVTWTYKDDPHAPASQFYIQKLMVLGKAEWTNTTGSIPVVKNVFRITDLTPGTIYRFRVFAANHFGSSQPSEISNRFLVGDDIYVDFTRPPVQKPIITRCDTESTSSIIVEWRYDKKLETQPVDGYYIYHRADIDDDDIYESKLIGNAEITRYVIKNLENDMLYDIKMQTFNIAGRSDYSNIMSASTDSVNVALTPDFMKPEYKPPATPKSPIDVQVMPETSSDSADKEEILYICIGVILGTFVIIFLMFAGMCIWRSRQPNGMFGAINWSGYYGRAPPYSKGSQDINNRYMNGCPVYDQQGHNGGPYSTPNGHIEPRPLYMMPQDTEMPIDVSQYLSAEQNEMNQNGSTILGSQHGTLERRHPSYVRPVKREDLKLTPNGIVCRPTHHTYNSNGDIHRPSHPYNSNGDIHRPSHPYNSNGDIHRPSHPYNSNGDIHRPSHPYNSNGDIHRPSHPYNSNGDVYCQSTGNSDIHSRSSRDIRYHSNNDVCCQPISNEVSKHVTRKASHNSLAHESIAEDDQTQVPQKSTQRITQQRLMRNSAGDTSNEDTALSRSRSSSANSSQSTHSIVESDV